MKRTKTPKGGNTFELQHEGDTVLAKMTGETEAGIVATLKQRLGEAMEDGQCRRVALDASGLHFMDSTGISLLVYLQKQADALDKQFVLLCPSREVRNVLELVQLTGFFTVREGLDG